MKNTTYPTYKNLEELLQGDTPYHYGRSLYKYTACGPWITYVIRTAPAYKRSAEVIIGLKKGKLVILQEVEQLLEHDNINKDDRQFLGFSEDGKTDLKVRSLKGYLKMVQDFISDKNHGRKHVSIISYDRSRITLGITEDMPETTTDVFYDTEEANKIDITKCIGIKVGSIVEGSDVEISPAFLAFPFTSKDFDDTVKAVNDEATFYWERDNSTWLKILKNEKPVGYAKGTWGEWEFEDKMPKKVKEAVKKMGDFNDKGEIPNCKGYTYEEDESMRCSTY